MAFQMLSAPLKRLGRKYPHIVFSYSTLTWGGGRQFCVFPSSSAALLATLPLSHSLTHTHTPIYTLLPCPHLQRRIALREASRKRPCLCVCVCVCVCVLKGLTALIT